MESPFWVFLGYFGLAVGPPPDSKIISFVLASYISESLIIIATEFVRNSNPVNYFQIICSSEESNMAHPSTLLRKLFSLTSKSWAIGELRTTDERNKFQYGGIFATAFWLILVYSADSLNLEVLQNNFSSTAEVRYFQIRRFCRIDQN